MSNINDKESLLVDEFVTLIIHGNERHCVQKYVYSTLYKLLYRPLRDIK